MSLGIMILVAWPSATFANASRALSLRTASSAPAFLRASKPSASACLTRRIDLASASLILIKAWASPSACLILACFSASALIDALSVLLGGIKDESNS